MACIAKMGLVALMFGIVTGMMLQRGPFSAASPSTPSLNLHGSSPVVREPL
jgi:hypothetical protein